MNGRNGPSFVTSNRVDDAKTLVKRMQEGLVSQKYKQVDYAQLKAAAAQKRAAGEQKLQKVNITHFAQKFGQVFRVHVKNNDLGKLESTRCTICILGPEIKGCLKTRKRQSPGEATQSCVEKRAEQIETRRKNGSGFLLYFFVHCAFADKRNSFTKRVDMCSKCHLPCGRL